MFTLTCVLASCGKEENSQGLEFYPKSDNTYVVAAGKAIYLESIVIPAEYNGKAVSEIAPEGFKKCTNLTSITIPKSIKSIGTNAFSGCKNLTEIKFNATEMSSSDGFIFNLAGHSGDGITVTIGKNVTKIPDNLFYAFSASPKITNVEFEKGSVCDSIGESAFFCCESLENITIPDSVTSIGDLAFSCCNGLENVIVGSSVTSIGKSAFSSCKSLENITIPDSVTSIGEDAFSHCTKLKYKEYKNAYYLGNDENKHTVLVKAKSQDIPSCIIHDDTRFISSSAFNNCSKLKRITIPDGVTGIGNSAFSNCKNLESITIPDSVTSIGYEVFHGCTKLEYNEYKNGYYLGNDKNKRLVLVEVAPYSVTNFNIHDDTRFIYDYAFAWCDSLKSITIHDNVKSIGARTFIHCESLESISIPDGVTSIGSSTFSGCYSLESISIPNSVTNIGEYAFYYCESLVSIDYSGTKAQWNKIKMDDDWDFGTEHYTVHCSDGNVEN